MKLIINHSTDPAFNLALEEVLLTASEEEIILLWRNRPAVIIGRNQNAHAEIDFDFLQQHDITLIRRLTGGGAVFHDLGNLNFTLLTRYEEGRFNDYKHFTKPVIGYLETLGVRAEQTGRNDLTIDGAKFSGNAQTVHKNRILHHGTLLFHADLSRLAGALRPDPEKIASKGIKSVASRVTNIYSHLPDNRRKMTIDDFMSGLAAFFESSGAVSASLSEEQIQSAHDLVTNKYGQWDWNFGRSPAYQHQRKARFAGGAVMVCLSVGNGILSDVRILGDFLGSRQIEELERKLIAAPHRPESVKEILLESGVESYIMGVSTEELLSLFF